MDIRSKKCRLCGHRSGLFNLTCGSCDSDDLYVVTESIREIDESFWVVTLSRAVLDINEAFAFQESILEATDRWREYANGHGFKPDSLIVEGGLEMGLLELFWDFPYDQGVELVGLVSEISRLRPGVADEAQVSVDFYDTVDVKGDE